MKAKLLAAFEAELKVYPWAANAEKLETFMIAAKATLNGGNQIDRAGPAWQKALIACGLPARITLQALHELPA